MQMKTEILNYAQIKDSQRGRFFKEEKGIKY